MNRYYLYQQIRLNVYDTAADMPSEFQQIMTNILRAWPQTLIALGIGFGVIGLIFLYRFIIRRYRNEEDFWRYFTTINCILALGLAGFIYTHIYSIQIWLTNSTIEVSIVKDESLVATVDSSLFVRKNWINGHNVLASTPTPITAVVPRGSVYASEMADANISISIVNSSGKTVDLSSDAQFIDSIITGTYDSSNYQIIIAADEDTESGEYEGEAEWTVDQRDTMISVATAQRYIDTSKDNKMLSDGSFNTIGKYLESDDIPNEFMYRTDCKDKNDWELENCLQGKYPKFHHWLNAPHPIYRENIKAIKFVNNPPGKPYDPETKTGNQNCWDISEHQSGQVVACYKKSFADTDGQGVIKTKDIEGWGISTVANIVQAIGDIVNDLGCVAKWLLPFADNCEDGDWKKDTMVLMRYDLGLYDIEIGQEGGEGVTAPTNSSNLFFYTGQNTDYFLLNRQLIPRNESRQWMDVIDWGIPGIPIISFALNILNELANMTEDMIIYTKVCSYVRYYTYGVSTGAPVQSKDCLVGATPTRLDNLSIFHVDNVTNMTSMFEGAKFNKLSSILDDIKTKTGNVTNMRNMFKNNNDTHSFDVVLNTSKVKDFSGIFSGSRFGTCGLIVRDPIGDSSCSNTHKIDIGDRVNPYAGNRPDGTVEVIPGWDTSSAEDMSDMFSQTTGATDILFAGLNTDKVQNMSNMFAATRPKNLDLSSFNTSNVTNMSGMFSGALVRGLDIAHFDTSKVTDMSKMFENLYNGVTITSGLPDYMVGNNNDGIQEALKKSISLDLTNFDTSNVTNMAGMFSGSNIVELDLTNFDTSEVTSMRDMFFSLGGENTLVDLSSFDTTNVLDMAWMFANFTPDIRVGECDNGKIVKVEQKDPFTGEVEWVMPTEKGAAIYVPVSNARIEDQTKSVTMVLGDLFKSIFAIGGHEEEECVDPEPNLRIDRYGIDQAQDRSFSSALLNLTSFNTRNVMNMEGMFTGSRSDRVTFTPATTEINDKGEEEWMGFYTGNVTNMNWMFAGISYNPIIRVPFDTSKVTTMVGMFAGMANYTSNSLNLDITSFTTTEKTDMGWMFAQSCIKDQILVSDNAEQFYIPGPSSDYPNEQNNYIFGLVPDTCAAEFTRKAP